LKDTNFVIYIVTQSDDGKAFNRGKLLNVGFQIACDEGCDIFIFHDVDLMPSSELLQSYASTPSGKSPVHIARLWNRYNGNAQYFGGIVAFSKAQFEEINGYPNNFWGWGGEDDELMKRVKEVKFEPTWPEGGTITDYEEMNLTEKLEFLRGHKEWKCKNKWEMLDEHDSTWRVNGLMDLTYIKKSDTIIESFLFARRITVDISGDGNKSS
jgi:hypothetical protein